MKTFSLLVVAGFFVLTLSLPSAGADAKTEVTEAIKKLEQQSNYSWVATPKTEVTPKPEGAEARRRQGAIEGKIEKSGLIYLKGSSGDNSYEAAFKGDKFIVNFNEDWIEPSDLPVDDGRIEQRLKPLKVTPVEQATKLLGTLKEIKKADGHYEAELTEEAAKTLFATLGRRAAEAPTANGSVKFWLQDGRLSKYELKVEGKFTVGSEKRETQMTRTTTVEIKDVGTTKITLPEAARNRLG